MRKLFVLVAAALFAPSAFALSSFNPGNLSGVTQPMVDEMVKTIALGSAHHPFASASPLGLLLGFDVGVSVSAITLPTDFQTALKTATQSPAPAAIPMPKLVLRKGLPFHIDVGFSYFGYQNYSLYGADVQWAFVPGGLALPAVSFRLSQSLSKLFFFTTRSTAFDFLVSKSLGWIFDPYLGLGFETYSGDMNVPLGGATGLPLSISGHSSGSTMRFMAGFPIKLAFFRVSPEYEYSFAGFSTYGAKVSFGF